VAALKINFMRIAAMTEFYLFNENGFLLSDDLTVLCNAIAEKLGFFLRDSTQIGDFSHCELKLNYNEVVFYKEGYVVKFEGDILMSIKFLKEMDAMVNSKLSYYCSPTQATLNKEEFRYPRGASILEIGEFLDEIFCNKDYSDALRNELK
jgi:hypothetical protein